MKKIIIIVLFPFLGLGQDNKENIDNGFKNYVFGTSPNEFKNLTLEIEEGTTKLYSVSPPIKIDGVEFEYLRCTFYKEKLSVISLQTKNSGGKLFLQILKAIYGDPNKPSKQAGYYEWVTNKTQLVFATDNSEKEATIDFYYKEISPNKK